MSVVTRWSTVGYKSEEGTFGSRRHLFYSSSQLVPNIGWVLFWQSVDCSSSLLQNLRQIALFSAFSSVDQHQQCFYSKTRPNYPRMVNAWGVSLGCQNFTFEFKLGSPFVISLSNPNWQLVLQLQLFFVLHNVQCTTHISVTRSYTVWKPWLPKAPSHIVAIVLFCFCTTRMSVTGSLRWSALVALGVIP